MTLEEIKAKYDNKEYFKKVKRRTWKNKEVAVFYEWLADEREEVYYDGLGADGKLEPNRTYMNIARNMRSCCQLWDINYYPFQGIKDMIRTNACHNRFCDNCQNVLAVQRARKYGPILDALSNNYDIYHIVLTVPNCKKEFLSFTIDNMYQQIKYFVRLFSGNAKIKGLDFSGYGFFGAIRATEITKNQERDDFHPHLHTLFLFKKGLDLDKNRTHINKFSFDSEHVKRSHHKKVDGKPVNLFSDFDILLQKIWRLRIDGIRVTLKSIRSLKEGYSVFARNANGNYKETFKYATKGVFPRKEKTDKTEDMDGFDGVAELDRRHQEFVTLRDALDGRRIIQAYGKLNNFEFPDEIDQTAENDDEYWKVVGRLAEFDSAEQVFESFDYICKEAEKKNVVYISRRSISEVLGKGDEIEWELSNE